MTRLAQTDGRDSDQHDILRTLRNFVDRGVIPHASVIEHAYHFPTDVVEGMRELGLFGLRVPEAYGGLGVSLLTYALVVEELSRGWMSLSGILNTHFIVAYLLSQHGT